MPMRALAQDAPPATPPAGADLEAGGLKPPAPVANDTDSPPATPEAQLDLADKEDSGRGLSFVWLTADAGGEYLGLHTLKSNQLVDSSEIKSKGLGAVYGAGLGVRLLVFTFGARFRLGNFEDWQVWTLGGEAGLRIPLGSWEPYVTVGAGYASLGDFKGSDVAASLEAEKVKATGLDARAGGGVDYYLTNTLSVGANLTGEVLFLGRAGDINLRAPGPTGSSPVLAGVYGSHGSGIGLGAELSAVLGLHF
ncbi:MAG TPA: outer membrane beta-barrel protein [Polyangiaceae bacterium]|nr:outer membrane beta-barrel protein [Polyangiaceae bacterium]